MFEVVYYSKGGNTKKVAEAIAAELGVTIGDVTANKEPAEDRFLFLGSGCYAGRPGEEMQEFIAENNFNGKNVALFGTSEGGKGDEVNIMGELLKAKGALIQGVFYCKGQSSTLNLGRPNDDDLARAGEFAREMKKL